MTISPIDDEVASIEEAFLRLRGRFPTTHEINVTRTRLVGASDIPVDAVVGEDGLFTRVEYPRSDVGTVHVRHGSESDPQIGCLHLLNAPLRLTTSPTSLADMRIDIDHKHVLEGPPVPLISTFDFRVPGYTGPVATPGAAQVWRPRENAWQALWTLYPTSQSASSSASPPTLQVESTVTLLAQYPHTVAMRLVITPASDPSTTTAAADTDGSSSSSARPLVLRAHPPTSYTRCEYGAHLTPLPPANVGGSDVAGLFEGALMHHDPRGGGALRCTFTSIARLDDGTPVGLGGVTSDPHSNIGECVLDIDLLQITSPSIAVTIFTTWTVGGATAQGIGRQITLNVAVQAIAAIYANHILHLNRVWSELPVLNMVAADGISPTGDDDGGNMTTMPVDVYTEAALVGHMVTAATYHVAMSAHRHVGATSTTDLFHVPTLLVTHPTSARPMLDARYAQLTEATTSADALGMDGAYFVWRPPSDTTRGHGGDATTDNVDSIMWEVSRAPHVFNTAAVASNAWRYYAVYRDEGWLRTKGMALISDIMAFLSGVVTRVYNDVLTHSSTFSVHVFGVRPVDGDPTKVVDDDYFTNVMIMLAADAAIQAYTITSSGRAPPMDWLDIRDRMYIPSPPESLDPGMHPYHIRALISLANAFARPDGRGDGPPAPADALYGPLAWARHATGVGMNNTTPTLTYEGDIHAFRLVQPRYSIDVRNISAQGDDGHHLLQRGALDFRETTLLASCLSRSANARFTVPIGNANRVGCAQLAWRFLVASARSLNVWGQLAPASAPSYNVSHVAMTEDAAQLVGTVAHGFAQLDITGRMGWAGVTMYAIDAMRGFKVTLPPLDQLIMPPAVDSITVRVPGISSIDASTGTTSRRVISNIYADVVAAL